MIECFEVVKSNGAGKPAYQLSLNYEQRQKSRGKALANSGEEIAWFLPRANVLADGEFLATNDGTLVQVVAAEETLSEVICQDPLLLTKAAYHLGNRHVPLQINENRLSYQHDHVLDAMIVGLGLIANCVQKPFHPESGAYHTHGNGHSHDHSHSHEH